MEADKAFSLVLRQLRKEKKLSQQQLAFDANLDRTYISLLERNLRQPTITTFFQLSSTLGIAPESFICRIKEQINEIDSDESPSS